MGTNNRRGKILVWGIGINDVDAPTRWMENGKWVKDPYYSLWKGILERSYNPEYKKRNPTYISCTTHPDWHRFSKFKEWVDNQPQKDWRVLYLDKDLRVKGGKVYGPDTCCFLTPQENTIFRLSGNQLGSCRYRNDCAKSPWESLTNIGHRIKGMYLGCYTTKEEAVVVAGRESIKRIMEVVNANPHEFIRKDMMRWVEEWKQEVVLREERWATIRVELPLFEISNETPLKPTKTNCNPLFPTSPHLKHMGE